MARCLFEIRCLSPIDSSFNLWHVILRSKLTAKAPQNRPSKKERIVSQAAFFSGKFAVSFREGMDYDFCIPYVIVMLSVYQFFLCWGVLQDIDHPLQILK